MEEYNLFTWSLYILKISERIAYKKHKKINKANKPSEGSLYTFCNFSTGVSFTNPIKENIN